jgi:tRNA modification GTPase
LGVERSRQAVARADLVLFLLDAGEPLHAQDHEIADLLSGRPAVVVLNKSDLPPAVSPDAAAALLPGSSVVPTAAHTGAGVETLEEAVAALVLSGRANAGAEPLVSNPRHKEALWRAREHLVASLETWRQSMPADFVTIDLAAAVGALGEITGESVTEDLLETIFSQFCIGK